MAIDVPTLKPSSDPAGLLGQECAGGFGIRIARDGVWWHQGRPILRPELVRLFARVLRRDAAGAYWLQTPVERGRIEVEDAPFIGVELQVQHAGTADQALDLRTNIDDWVQIGPNCGLRVVNDATGAPHPYVHVRDGLEARLNRPVFYQLADLAQGEGLVAVLSRGIWFPLGMIGP